MVPSVSTRLWCFPFRYVVRQPPPPSSLGQTFPSPAQTLSAFERPRTSRTPNGSARTGPHKRPAGERIPVRSPGRLAELDSGAPRRAASPRPRPDSSRVLYKYRGRILVGATRGVRVSKSSRGRDGSRSCLRRQRQEAHGGPVLRHWVPVGVGRAAGSQPCQCLSRPFS